MISNPELCVESIANISWKRYIEEMANQGTWCDNVIMQAVSNSLSCVIYITDSCSLEAIVITPVNSQQVQTFIFLGYIQMNCIMYLLYKAVILKTKKS